MSHLSAADWEARYRDQETPWDLQSPTPEFRRLLTAGTLPRRGRVIVPGGGRGHDAVLFAQAGYEVSLVDFAPSALAAAQVEAAQAKTAVFTYRKDFFALAQEPFHSQAYDIFLEYTFFCAIDPSLRAAYAAAAAKLLRPHGVLVGLFFPTSSEKKGPPFLVSREEVEALFRPYFELDILEPQQSVKPRAGREFLGIFKKRR